ncbi:hypothetical protein DYBT9623_05578 [Dyadobacter sp. CECT 9623]|uniref:Uncharacterized protein n=1 Tax=Dyadobacter linearis TaxID=2823330 RepID=A0ABN7RFL6_9BACT|nr:hypothetical protein DYBT9623_05578 [Dyadobacter sp. CECT 9623]
MVRFADRFCLRNQTTKKYIYQNEKEPLHDALPPKS